MSTAFNRYSLRLMEAASATLGSQQPRLSSGRFQDGPSEATPTSKGLSLYVKQPRYHPGSVFGTSGYVTLFSGVLLQLAARDVSRYRPYIEDLVPTQKSNALSSLKPGLDSITRP